MSRRGRSFPDDHRLAPGCLSLRLRVAHLFGRCACGGAALLLVACATSPPSPRIELSSSASPQTTPQTDAGVRPCGTTDLTGSGRFQGATGSLAGGLSLVNNASTACVLPGHPRIQLVDAQGKALPVNEQAAPLCNESRDTSACVPRSMVVVQPGQEARARLVWQNWCGPMPDGPITLEMSLLEPEGPLSVVLEPAGAPLVDTPRCDTPDSPSTLLVGPLE
jgi:Protein of unknown function (DUF4232)